MAQDGDMWRKVKVMEKASNGEYKFSQLVVKLLQKCKGLPECIDNMLAVSMFVKTWVYFFWL